MGLKLRIITGLLLLCSIAGHSQKLTEVKNTFGYNWNRALADTLLGIPNDTFAIPSSPVNYKLRPWVAYKNDAIYYWSVAGQRWTVVSASGGGTVTGGANGV